MESENESLLTGYPDTITYECTKKIKEQMEKNICKIKIGQNQGTGFFCKIPFPDINNMLPVFITNNHIINQDFLNKENANIKLDIKEETEKIDINLNNRMKYTNEKYDTTIIEIKEEDKIKNYLKLDDIIINDILNKENKNNEYEDKTLYIIQYPKGQLSVSYGILVNIALDKKYDFNHKCSTEHGSSGSPILTLNNKIIGIHKKGGYNNNFNKGTFLNFPIKEFIELNFSKDKSNNNILNENINYKYKIVFMGDSYSGKTEVIHSIIDPEPEGINESSIARDFYSKEVVYKNKNLDILFQIWNISGESLKYRNLIHAYVRNSSLIFLIYDIGSRKTFDNLNEWIDSINCREKVKIILCGNNYTLEERKVSKEEGEEFAKKKGLTFFEICTKTNYNIKNMFYSSIAELPIFNKEIKNKEKFIKELIEENENKFIKSPKKNKDNECLIY